MRIFIFFILALSATVCAALDFEYNGMWFELTSAGANPTCALTMPPKKYKFPKRFVIPSSVKYNGIDVSVVKIKDRAFAGGKKIKTIVVPPTVKTITARAFAENRKPSYFFSDDFPVDCDSIIFEDGPDAIYFQGKSDKRNACYPMARYMYLGRNIQTDHKTLDPDDVGSGGAFRFMSPLKELNVGSQVTYVPKYAFEGIESLQTVDLGSSITMIGDFAFAECEQIEEIKLPNSLTVLGFDAFDSCTKLKIVSFGENIERVEYDFDECNELKCIICRAQIPPKLWKLAPEVCFNATLLVPIGSLELYKEAPGWSDFVNIQEIRF